MAHKRPGLLDHVKAKLGNAYAQGMVEADAAAVRAEAIMTRRIFSCGGYTDTWPTMYWIVTDSQASEDDGTDEYVATERLWRLLVAAGKRLNIAPNQVMNAEMVSDLCREFVRCRNQNNGEASDADMEPYVPDEL